MLYRYIRVYWGLWGIWVNGIWVYWGIWGVWVNGYMGIWVYGYMGKWYMGLWVTSMWVYWGIERNLECMGRCFMVLLPAYYTHILSHDSTALLV